MYSAQEKKECNFIQEAVLLYGGENKLKHTYMPNVIIPQFVCVSLEEPNWSYFPQTSDTKWNAWWKWAIILAFDTSSDHKKYQMRRKAAVNHIRDVPNIES